MKILHTADWHIDQSNLEYTVPAIEAAIAAAGDYDLFVHAGDLAIHRGKIHPNVAWEIRRLMSMALQYGLDLHLVDGILVPGNHDISYQSRTKGMAPGILAGDRPDYGFNGDLIIANQPMIKTRFGIDFLCVPSPSKHQMQVAQENDPELAEMDPRALMVEMIRGLIAGHDPTRPLVGIYHGAFAGAVLGNEQLMTAGMSLTLPKDAFAGCRFVMAGDIHQRQILDQHGPCPIYYPGASAPLTWNDKRLSPVWYMYDINLESGQFKYSVSEVRVPVLSQMIELELTVDGDQEIADWHTVLSAVVDSNASHGDRVRIDLAAPGAVIDTLNKKIEVEIQEKYGFKQLAVVKTRTDAVRARFNVGSDWSIPTAFQQWALIKGLNLDSDSLEPLLDIVHDVEGLIEDKHLDAHYECKPISIEAENWCQFPKIKIDFNDLSSLVAIAGDNYAGKSNLSCLWEFSRYKKTHREHLGKLIRLGEDRAQTQETFESHGQVYRIVRTLKRKSNGSADAKCVFMQQTEGGEWESIIEGTAADTQTAIERLIGPYDIFTATTFAGANSATSLCSLTPADMKDVLLSVLQRDFAGRAKIVNSWIAAATKELDKFDAQISVLDNGMDMTADLENSLKEEKALVVLNQEDLAKQTEELKGLQVKLYELTEALKKIDAQCAAALDIQKEVDSLDEQISEIGDKIVSANEALQEQHALRVEIDGLPSDDEVASMQQDRDALQLAAVAIQDTIEEVKQSYVDILTPKQEEYVELDKHLAGALKDQEHLEKVIKANEKIVADAVEVPCGGGEWERVISTSSIGSALNPMQPLVTKTELIDMSTCPLIAHVAAARSSLPAQELELRGLNDEVQQVGNDRIALALEVKGLIDERKEKLEVFEADSLLLMVKVNDANDRLSIIREEASARNQKETECARLESIVDGANGLSHKHCELVAERSKKAEAIQSAEGDGELRLSKQVAINLAEVGIHNQETSIEKIGESIKASDANIVRYTTQLETAVESLERMKAVRKQSMEARTKKARLSTVAEALNRDGIPYLLLEQYAIPHLQQAANNYLKNTEITIAIDSERELGDGSLRNEVRITYTDHRGVWSLSDASGMQRTVIEMALRNALADLLAMATGSKIWFCLQDEGFGTMQEKHLDGAKRTLRQIANERGWMLFISHIVGMEECADDVLRIVDNNGVSIVEVA